MVKFSRFMACYNTLDGESINLGLLSKDEIKHIDSIEALIDLGVDFETLSKHAFAYMEEGVPLTPQKITELFNSPAYKIVVDLVKRYELEEYYWKNNISETGE